MNDKYQDHLNNDFKQAISKLEGHARVANEEMGHIKTDMAVVKNDIYYVKKEIETVASKIDKSMWLVVTTLLGVLLSLILSYFKL